MSHTIIEARAPAAREVRVASSPDNGQLLTRLLEAVGAPGGTEELARRVLELALDVTGGVLGVIRVREGQQLAARAALGLDEEVGEHFSLPASTALAGMEPVDDSAVLFLSTDPETAVWSRPMRDRSLRAVYALPLRPPPAPGAPKLDATSSTESLLGVVYIGAPKPLTISPEQRAFLTTIATHACNALSKRHALEHLEQAIRARDDLLAVVSHDLRNPLNVISVSANSMLRRQPDPSMLRPIERVLRAAQRADRLVRDLLDVNAIEGGRFAVERRPLDPAEVLLSALESQQSVASDASVILTSDIAPALPHLLADEERVLEVLENLISNAVKFTEPGGIVTLGASHTDGEVKVWVKDSGHGIRPDQLPRLFDRFWQARRHDRRGTGLGLTICKAIVESHGGRIWAESTLGKGTSMFFTLPVTKDTREPAVDQTVSNILLVDDRPENLVALKAILQSPSYRLVTASSGEEALRLALREHFDVALIDVAMPGMDGVEVAGHMRALERCRDIPILFVTAFGNDPQEIHRAYAAGGADYLVKPLDAEIVRKKVAVFAGLRKRREAESR